MKDIHPIVTELERIRHGKGNSRRLTAGLAGVSHQTVMRWENGQRTPGLQALTLYAKSLGYRLELVPDTEAHRG